MPLYNFQPRFVPLILSGQKTHTIRAKRKRQTLPGDTLYLYTGLRQKGAQRLLVTQCTRVQNIEIRDTKAIGFLIVIDDDWLSTDEKDSLALRDGFENQWDMLRFWDGRLPFKGDIIYWKSPLTNTTKGDQ
jgi:uncharacterized protein YqfB (UPF0267 family)